MLLLAATGTGHAGGTHVTHMHTTRAPKFTRKTDTEVEERFLICTETQETEKDGKATPSQASHSAVTLRTQLTEAEELGRS